MSSPKILVRTTNWIGDVVMNLPALDLLRRNYPDGEIVAVSRPWAGSLFRFRPDLIDRWVVLDDKHNFRALLSAAKQLRQENFTHAFAFTNHFKGALLPWLARVPVRAGFLKWETRLFLQKGLRRAGLPPSGRHQSLNYVDLLASCGLDTGAPVTPRLHRIPDLAEAATAKHLNAAPRPWLLVHAGAAYGTAKRWLPERYGAVAKTFLAERGGSVVLLGVDSEREVNRTIAETAPAAINLCGQTSLVDSLALIGEADAFLSNDSGLMHVAGAFGVPQVAIFGPTDPYATYPPNVLGSVVHEPVACSPCFKRHCPIGHDCMVGVEADRVWQRLNDMLEKANQSRVI